VRTWAVHQFYDSGCSHFGQLSFFELNSVTLHLNPLYLHNIQNQHYKNVTHEGHTSVTEAFLCWHIFLRYSSTEIKIFVSFTFATQKLMNKRPEQNISLIHQVVSSLTYISISGAPGHPHTYFAFCGLYFLSCHKRYSGHKLTNTYSEPTDKS